MIPLSKAFWAFQIHLTAVMTLTAGLPQVFCVCSPDVNRRALPQTAIRMYECHCCGSCGSMALDDNPSATSRNQSCCSSANRSEKSQTPGNSRQAKGKRCLQEVMPTKAAVVLTTQTSQLMNPLTEDCIAFPATLVPTMQIGPLEFEFHWTGHSIGPPGDLVTSLQRLLI
jgi:hypothetical protein